MEQHTIPDNALFDGEITSSSPETGYESLVETQDNGAQSLSVLVGGVTCGLCIQKIESALSNENDVKSANLNFSAKRLFIEWHGKPRRANDFVHIVRDLGYSVRPYDASSAERSAKQEGRFLLLCLGIAGFAMGNVMLLSVGVWSTTSETMGIGTRDLLHWISAAIAIPAILYAGRPFFRSAYNVLKNGHTNMDVPISLALILAGGMSLLETFRHGEHVYFDSALMLIFFLLIGRYLDFKARENARSSAHDLLQSFQGFATVIDRDKTRRVLIRDLKEGMFVRVASGEKFPVDGIIDNGQSTVDTSLVTGETLPRDLKKDDEVFAGTLNLSAPVTMQVAKAAKDSLLSDIVRLMDKAGQAQAAYVRIADKAAKLYTPIVHSLALITFLGWILIGGMAWQDSLMIAITVLIITCPCALGLAVPVVQVLATGSLMKKGVFVKSGDALERLAAIDTAIFDKTGTLTLGTLTLIDDYPLEHLKLAASLAAHSSHPLSKSLGEAYNGDHINLENIEEISGSGLSAVLGGKTIKLGSRAWCGDKDAPSAKYSELWLNIDNQPIQRFLFEDVMRTDTPDIIHNFKQDNIKLLLVSGDRKQVVERVALDAGIDKSYAEQTPPQKFEIMDGLQNDNRTVMMVGDGLNDAPVMAKANVSIAPGTAVDMAQNAADIIFMGDKLSPIWETYRIAKRTQSLVKQNFLLAIIYNLIAIPMAIAGFVTPFIAALAMSGSSILVIANSFRLKRHT